MNQVGAPYSVVDGTLFLPFGNNGMVARISRGTARKSASNVRDVSGPATTGNMVFSLGNYRYDATVRGTLTEGKKEYAGVTYTHATKTLSKTGAFADVAVGESVYVDSGTNVTQGWYEIATNADDDTVTLVTAPGAANASDFVIYGITTLTSIDTGTATLQMGNGETWSGTVWMPERQLAFNEEDPSKIDVVVALLFTGAVTRTPGVV